MSSGEYVMQRNAIITFVLNNCCNKLPFTSKELMEIAGKKEFNSILQETQEALRAVYGLILKEVPVLKGGRKFICYSQLSMRTPFSSNDQQSRHLLLLFLILSLIFMSSQDLLESEIEAFLYSLGINVLEAHPFFGRNIKKLITDTFVKQMYLTKTKSDSELCTDVEYLYAWGFRAEMEFNKRLVLEASAKILGRPAESFMQQFDESQLVENEVPS